MEPGAHPQSPGAESNPLGQCGNIAPAHQVPALRRVGRDAEAGGAEGGALLVALRWGLIPSWVKGVAPKFGTIMATCEPHLY